MSDKVAVVTGSSSGIGKNFCEHLIQDGWKVYGLSRSRGSLEGIIWIHCDVTDSASIKEAFNTILKDGTPDLVLINAGMGISGAAEYTTESNLRLQLDTNLTGAIMCAQQVIEPMRKRGSGKIIFTSSLAAIFPIPFQSFYSVSKSGITAFSDALGLEVKPFGIQTSCLLLGDIKTGFTDARVKDLSGNDVYASHVENSVHKMEKSERSGASPDTVSKTMLRIVRRKHLPAHKVVGFGNLMLVFLGRIFPTGFMLKILNLIYG